MPRWIRTSRSAQVRLGALKNLSEFLKVLTPSSRKVYLPALDTLKEVCPVIQCCLARCSRRIVLLGNTILISLG